MSDTDPQAQTSLAAYNPSHNAAALILDPTSMKSMMDIAVLMAGGKASVPAHLRGNPADCMAIVIQAMQWQMNPFAVASKTFIVNGGQLSYEAQLVNAVITSKAPVTGRLNFEWFGKWENVIGKMKEVVSTKKKDEDTGEFKKYRFPNWTLEDEKGLGIKVWATFKGENEPRTLELLLAQVRTRNSTLWAEDPKQQIAYLVTKKWARLFCPDVILGVYTPDEFDDDGYAPVAPAPQSSGSASGFAGEEFGPASDDEATIVLFRELLAIAKTQKIEDYAAAWAKLSAPQRKRIGLVCHEKLKSIAETVDAVFSEVNEDEAQTDATADQQ